MTHFAINCIIMICLLVKDINPSSIEFTVSLASPVSTVILFSSLFKSNNAEYKKCAYKSLDAKVCGSSVSACPKYRYRSYDGSCNNLKNPSWGTPNSPYGQLVRNNYADGVYAWPKATKGGLLPNPREISLKLFTAKNAVADKWNLNTQQWGQVITHDMSFSADPEVANQTSPTCCDSNGQFAPDADTSPLCKPIIIPDDDNTHVPEGRKCMDFVRTANTIDIGCTSRNTPAIPLSVVTPYMDLSLTYGNNKNEATSLRAGKGGRLKTTVRNGREWPPQAANAMQSCRGSRSSDDPCYKFGDSRGNQSPQLAVLQTILVYEHNRIADQLSKLNPHWDDETIFQEARRICIAEIQRINYYEYLIILLGKKNMTENKLIYPDEKGYVYDYDANVNPAVLKEHATAALRHFHTMIRGFLELIKENRELAYTVQLSDWFNRPSLLEMGNGFDDLVRGLSYQPADKSDEYWDSEITQNLFRENRTSGEDLRATDIQRGRDFGLGTFVKLRAFCGLSVPQTFSDLEAYISKKNVNILKSLYKMPEDIDLVVGGSLEKHVSGALVGPTFLCILLKQFRNTRISDRFFFENGANKNIAFTLPQLKTIREGASMARLLCDNGHDIRLMQRKAFELVSHENPLVLCSQLPSVNLTLWKETQR